MSQDKRPDPAKDTSQPGREEEVIVNTDEQHRKTNGETAQVTNLPVKDKEDKNETEGERRFKEGLANNSDTTP
jgi:hypothetical protein